MPHNASNRILAALPERLRPDPGTAVPAVVLIARGSTRDERQPEQRQSAPTPGASPCRGTRRGNGCGTRHFSASSMPSSATDDPVTSNRTPTTPRRCVPRSNSAPRSRAPPCPARNSSPTSTDASPTSSQNPRPNRPDRGAAAVPAAGPAGNHRRGRGGRRHRRRRRPRGPHLIQRPHHSTNAKTLEPDHGTWQPVAATATSPRAKSSHSPPRRPSGSSSTTEATCAHCPGLHAPRVPPQTQSSRRTPRLPLSSRRLFTRRQGPLPAVPRRPPPLPTVNVRDHEGNVEVYAHRHLTDTRNPPHRHGCIQGARRAACTAEVTSRHRQASAPACRSGGSDPRSTSKCEGRDPVGRRPVPSGRHHRRAPARRARTIVIRN